MRVLLPLNIIIKKEKLQSPRPVRLENSIPGIFPAVGVPFTVQALASQGGEITLDDTFVFDSTCSNPLMMSPSLRGSDPYPCGSLTYRTICSFSRYLVYIMPIPGGCQPVPVILQKPAHLFYRKDTDGRKRDVKFLQKSGKS